MNTVFQNENDWIGLIIFICVEHKKELPDQTKITSIMILFYGIFKKCLAFLKQNRKDSYVFVLIWRVLRMAEGKTEIIWWTWQKKMDLYIPWRGQSQIKVLLDIQRSQGRNSDLQEKQILQNVSSEQIYDESFNRVVFNYVQLNNYGQIRKELQGQQAIRSPHQRN